jgi:hypothetical protein
LDLGSYRGVGGSMFVLGEKQNFGDDCYELYTGKTYMVQGEYYPVTTKLKDEAKKYSTRAIAENACGKLIRKVGRLFEVLEV